MNIKRILTTEEVASALALRTLLLHGGDPESLRAAVSRDAAFLSMVEEGKVLVYEDEAGRVVSEVIVRH